MDRNGRLSKLMKANSGVQLSSDQVDRVISLVANITTSRQEWLRSKLQPDRRRDIYQECGFARAPTRELLRDFFKRDPIAGRVIDFMPKECWRKPPLVYEVEDGEEATAFEESWDNVGENLLSHPKLKMKSHYKREKYNPLWNYIKRLDILSGVGAFGVMLLGFDDIKADQGEDISSQLREPVKPKSGMKLNFVRVFPEWLVDVATRVTDMSDPRFDMPETYNITFNDPNENTTTDMQGTGPLNTVRTVHWTRVIHVPSDDLHSNEIYGPPRCESVLNNIQNCFKIASADPEGYWQSCFNILSAETHPSLGGDEIDIDKTAMKNLFEAMMQGLQRYGVFQGMSLKSIAPDVVDLTPHINAQIDLICIRKGWPIRIFKGSERGELASSQDEREHKGRVQERCEGHCSSNILIPLIDRLIWAKVLEEPAEENGFSLEWEDSTVHTELDKATVAKTKTEAMGAYVSSGVDVLMPPHEYLTLVMGYDDEEVEAILEAATEHTEEKQEKQLEDTQKQIDAGVIADPTKTPVLPPGAKGPPGAGKGPPGAKPAIGAKPTPGAKPFGGVKNAEGVDLVDFVENALNAGAGCGAGATGHPRFQDGNTCHLGGKAAKDGKGSTDSGKVEGGAGSAKGATDSAASSFKSSKDFKPGLEGNKAMREDHAKTAQEIHGEWGKGLSKEQRDAMEHYVSEDYKELNRKMRKGEKLEGKDAETQKNLDEAIDFAPGFKQETQLYRGVGEGMAEKLKVGAEFSDSAYTSTSTNSRIASSFTSEAVLEIRAPAGTKAASMDGAGVKPNTAAGTENEMILPRGTKYKVVGKRYDRDIGGDIITVEIVNG